MKKHQRLIEDASAIIHRSEAGVHVKHPTNIEHSAKYQSVCFFLQQNSQLILHFNSGSRIRDQISIEPSLSTLWKDDRLESADDRCEKWLWIEYEH